MTDPAFVVASYTIVVGGIVLYANSIVRRVRTARRTAQALKSERELDAAGGVSESPALVPRPSDPAR